MKWIFGLVLFACLGKAAMADVSNEPVPVVDSVRTTDAELQEKFKRQREIWYEREDPYKEDELESILKPFDDGLKAGQLKMSPGLVWILVVMAALVCLLLLFRHKIEKIWVGRQKMAKPLGEILSEDLHEIPLEDALDKAWKASAYDMVVRLLFLHYLKDLDEGGYLRWAVHKTNLDFAFEIQDAAVKSDFRMLALAYEAVWFGKKRVSLHQARDFERLSANVRYQLKAKEAAHA